MGALVQGASRGLGLALVRALLRRSDDQTVVATGRSALESAGLAQLRDTYGPRLQVLTLDVRSEESIARAAQETAERVDCLSLLLNCAGVLHADGLKPEKRLEHLEPAVLRHAFEVNAFGPLLVARHFLPFLRHPGRSVLANISARVGSIEDNHLGGWYAYRGSKAAQNMFTRTLSIELQRRAPSCICVAIHPGTVDTELSRPFQRGVPASTLQQPDQAAARILRVLDGLELDDTGSFRAWDGTPIPW
jgi:NAD(P)-dependent dehydrogenase (short-subunit alcohol dehydrogenase family)